MTHIVIGFGDVGRGIYEVLKDSGVSSITAIDKDSPISGHFDVAHICFPFSEQFLMCVKEYIQTFTPELIIIHSTVAPGTTEEVQKFFAKAVHSPVRGRFPSMSRDIKVYVKYFGGEYASEAAQIFSDAGIKVRCFTNPKTTELGKLLCNIRWGLNIAFAQEQKRICEKYGLNYAEVVNEFELSRNDGLKHIGRENATMPVLFPGHIGGHCVMPNVEILMQDYASGFLKAIKDSNDNYTK